VTTEAWVTCQPARKNYWWWWWWRESDFSLHVEIEDKELYIAVELLAQFIHDVKLLKDCLTSL
jgi:hypothetical protein